MSVGGGVLATESGEDKNRQQMIIDKHYQRMLFAYFQDDFFSALSLYEHVEKTSDLDQTKVSNPGIEPILLKGAMSLAYGLDLQAKTAFNHALNQHGSVKAQQTAWLLLGKSLYRQGQYSSAADALNNIDLTQAESLIEPSAFDELLYLITNLRSKGFAIHQGHERLVYRLSEDSPYRLYINYNKGVAFAQQLDMENAIAALSKATQASPSNNFDWFDWWTPTYSHEQNEIEALKDRANLPLGYIFLAQNKANEAVNAFQQIRIDSMDTHAGLLGLGWGAAQQQDYPLSLSIWQRLIDAKSNDEYEFDAYLASAFAYEQASSPSGAFNVLTQGLLRFAVAQQRLSDVRQLLQDEQLIYDVLSGSQIEHGLLASLLTSEPLQLAMQQLQEVQDIEHHHSQWLGKLNSFQQLLVEREALASRRMDELASHDAFTRLLPLQQEQQRLHSLIVQAEKSENNTLLLDADLLLTIDRLERAKSAVESIQRQQIALSQPPLSARYKERVKRLEGIVSWQASEGSEGRLHQAKSQLNEVTELLLTTKANQTKLQNRLHAAPDYSAQKSQIAGLSQQLLSQIEQNKRLKSALLKKCKEGVLAEINLRSQQLTYYQRHAKMEIARLQDQAFQVMRSSAALGEGYDQ